ncbi:MAG: D-alanine--D-alanine ligase, partial [Caldilineales bacterium]|nr:D-alanine--D-alanine ligase [Caldilineales bacterium]
AKRVFAAHGLPQTRWELVWRREWESEPEAVMGRLEERLGGYPLFVKPANLGSSVGVSKVHDRAELAAGLAEAAAYDRKIVVEQAVPYAREIEVAVLGNEDAIASIPGEIVPGNEFYDYAAKYLDGTSRLLIPAPLSAEQTEEVRRLALEAYRAIDGSGLSRVDFLLNDRTGEVFVNEVNTLPGFTAISMYPKLWEAGGLSYPRLLDRLIELALVRHADRRRNRIVR